MPIDTESMILVAIEKLDTRFNKLDEKVDKMGEVLSKQELLFERLISIDDKVERNNKLVHKRIDALEARVANIEKKPAQALGLFVRGVLTASGTAFAGWLMYKGVSK